MKYNIDQIIGKILRNIKPEYKRILIQLPDGLKPYSLDIVRRIYEEIEDIEIYIWFGSSFGACDIPIWLKIYSFDAIYHIGHSRFTRSW